MNVELPLDEMTTADKLAAIEQLWKALCKNPADVPSPSWHGDVLAARERRVSEGAAAFSELNEVKSRARNVPR